MRLRYSSLGLSELETRRGRERERKSIVFAFCVHLHLRLCSSAALVAGYPPCCVFFGLTRRGQSAARQASRAVENEGVRVNRTARTVFLQLFFLPADTTTPRVLLYTSAAPHWMVQVTSAPTPKRSFPGNGPAYRPHVFERQIIQ